ncbi:4Fe-4S single cluster domain-containing protein [Microbispora sp. NBC_01389]|uniref:4Fe-4S single cluster domain-containing protein n=1 Tax=Microbispora sp. NBC_01389 TaxID=2903584 RepID=UPI00324EA287
MHATIDRSAANGPGLRFVIWTQGCSLDCFGCFNPETHRTGGRAVSTHEVVEQVLKVEGIEGVTISGGEPLEQPLQLIEFLREIRQRSGIGIVLLTGFSVAEIQGDPARLKAAALADMVIAGRYNARLHLGTALRGSSNKEYWAITPRYSAEDFETVPEAEVVIATDGTIMVTGMHAWQGAQT